MPIQAINHGSTQGYQVRVGPRHASLTKFFAYRKYGGAHQALACARAAEIDLQKQAEPIVERQGPRLRPLSNNTSGVVGIRPRYSRMSETPYLAFVVSWSEGGKGRCTSFSAEKHGLIGALRMAMERREQATGMRYDITPRQALARMKRAMIDVVG